MYYNVHMLPRSNVSPIGANMQFHNRLVTSAVNVAQNSQEHINHFTSECLDCDSQSKGVYE